MKGQGEAVRVGLIRQRYTPHGGAERFAQMILDVLMARGHEVHLFANRWDIEGSLAKGLVFHRVPRLRGPGFLKVLSFAWLAPRAADHAGCRVIISLDRALGHPVYRAGDGVHRAWLEARAKHLPVWRRALLWLNPLHWTLLFLEARLLGPQGASLVIANSQRVRDEVRLHYGRSAESVKVIYNGVDTEHFHPGLRETWRSPMRRELGIPEDALVLLFVGSGFERKGLGTVIRAAGRLRRQGKDVQIVVVGKGGAGPYLKLSHEYDMDNRLRLLGPQSRVAPYYGCADIFVLPSLYEPFSNACLEALACGLPVITGRQNGVAEVMAGHGCGALLEDPSSPDEVSEALCLFTDPLQRVRAGHQSRAVALSLAWEAQVGRLVAVLEEMGRGKGL